ncbi:MAG TPA: hypothetical protein DCG89_09415 [Spartobacteria bacterium]|jgi:hypothetical protein|nr:hypothetical protein [Spartobacteria bacterium]
MSAEIKKEIQLEIAHVLFMDIVGYSKRLINEQRALRDTLNQIVRTTEEFRTAEAAGRLLKIPTGDGMAGFLALIYARTGEPDHALPLIERLLSTPGAVDNFEESITLTDLRLRWEWDPLRKDSRFQKILAGPEPKTVYN